MHVLLILLTLSVPSIVCAHGSGAVIPAPVPVTMAVYAGIFAVIATWLVMLRKKQKPTTYWYVQLPRYAFPLFLVVLTLMCIVATATNTLPLFWWFGVMTLGVVLSALISFSVDMRRVDAEKFSLAPLILFLLFAAEFFVPQFQTTKGIFFVIISYVLVITLALMVRGKSVLRHELGTRFVSALGSAAFVRTSRHASHLTHTDRWLITILVVATSFDGLLHSEYWRSLSLMLGIDTAALMPSLSLFASAVLLFNVFYYITVILMRDDIGARGEYSLSTLATHFTPAFVPIAIGYCLAHNVTRVPQLFADEYIVYTWGAQLACIIIGHILSVRVSHERAWALFQNQRRVTRSQFSMTVYMVLITGVSIMMLQAPL